MATIRRTNTKSGEHERWSGMTWVPEWTRINPKNGEHEVWGIFGWHPPSGPINIPDEERVLLHEGFDDVRQSQENAFVEFQSHLELLEQGYAGSLDELRWEMENRESEYAESLGMLESRVDELESERGEIASEIKNFRRENRLQHLKMFSQLDEILEGEEDIKDSLQEIIARLIAIEALNYATSVSSLEEAREAWRLSPHGTLAETVAERKWNQFALTRITAARTLEEGEQALRDCHEGSAAYQVAKEKVQLFRLCKVTTVKEAKALYDEIAPGVSIKALALKEWEFLALQQALAVETLAEAKQAFNDAPSDGNAREQAAQKWESLALAEVTKAKTLEELKAVLKVIPSHGSAQQLAKEKIAQAEAEAKKAKEEAERKAVKVKEEAKREAQRKLLISRIESAKTIAEIKSLFSEAPEHGNLRQIALKKWNQLSLDEITVARTVAQFNKVLRDSSPENKMVRLIASEKLSELALLNVKSSTSFSGVRNALYLAKKAFLDAPEDTAIKRLALERWEEASRIAGERPPIRWAREEFIRFMPEGGPARKKAIESLPYIKDEIEGPGRILQEKNRVEEKRKKKELDALVLRIGTTVCEFVGAILLGSIMIVIFMGIVELVKWLWSFS